MNPIETNAPKKTDSLLAGQQALNNTINHVSAAIHPAIDQLTSGAHNTVDKLADAACSAMAGMDAKTAQLAATRHRMAEKVRDQVVARPLTCLGIALASGVVMSWMMKSRTPRG